MRRYTFSAKGAPMKRSGTAYSVRRNKQRYKGIHAERKVKSPLNPLQSYLDQVQYEEDRFAETSEDNLFLKQLGKLFRYYGYQARTAIDQLRTDMFTGYLAFRTVFILQSNGHILYALTEPILALLSEPQEGGCHEEDDPLE